MGSSRLAGVHRVCAGVLAAALVVCLALGDADAKSKKRAPSIPARGKDAALVVDGVTGKVLYDRNADEIRYPASLTKMMTLYLLFEELKEGKIKLDSQITASSHAVAQEPTKLGLNAGDSISVELAIKAIVVRSANDVAVTIAEALGDTESNFAAIMTQKAHALGMTHTQYRNASGLPNANQLTTAHDLSILARHLAYDFPQYYPYFATDSFTYDGRLYETHDNLLGQFQGTDGIKTGYTRASGFNLVSSVVRDNKHIVGVIMGGKTANSRDNEMQDMLSNAFDKASETPTLVAYANVPWHDAPGPKTIPVYNAYSAPVQLASANVPAPTAKPAITLAGNSAPGVDSDDEDAAESASAKKKPVLRLASLEPALEEGDIGGPSIPVSITPSPASVAGLKKNWAIQIGAFGNQGSAKSQLTAYAERSMDVVGRAKQAVTPFTGADGQKLYRARFTDLGETEAREACKRMMTRGQTCFAIAN